MMASLDDLRFFTLVARLGSLTAVAREMGLTLPAVSKRLTLLEQRLGVQLVLRTTRRLDLTLEGERYVEGARPIISQLDELESVVSNSQALLTGRLNINASFGFGRRYIAPLISAFHRLHPELDIDLQLTSQPLNFLDSSVDIDLRIGEPPDSRLVAIKLKSNSRVVCASPAYLDKRGVPQQVTDLAQHNCIVLRQYESDYSLWRFTRAGKEYVQKVSGDLSSNDGETVVNYARDGHGIILRSKWDIKTDLSQGALIPVLTDYQAPDADIFAVYTYRKHVPARISVFITYLKQRLALEP